MVEKIPSYAEPIMDTTKELYADIEKGIADYEKGI